MIVTVGIQGPPGPTDFGKARISRVAGESLAAFIVVMVGSDGKVYRASKSTPEHINRVLGITLAAAAVNAAVDVHLFGEATNGAWTFDTTKLIWLGDDGALTQSAPTSGFMMVMGYPTSAGSMFVIPGDCAILASAGAGDAGKVVALDSTGKLALSLLPATLTGKDADTVDGYHAGNAAGKVPVLDGSALLPLAQVPATLTGKDADTVDGYHAGNAAGKVPVLDGSALLPLAQVPATLTGKNADMVDGYHAASLAKAGANSDITSLNAAAVGIGTESPSSPLHILRSSGSNNVIELLRLDSNEGGQYPGAGLKITFRDNSAYADAAAVEVQRQGASSGSDMRFRLRNSATAQMAIGSEGNVGINTNGQFGGGAGVIGLANATIVPSSNPSGGVVVYTDPADGKLKYRSASGETRTLSYTT